MTEREISGLHIKVLEQKVHIGLLRRELIRQRARIGRLEASVFGREHPPEQRKEAAKK